MTDQCDHELAKPEGAVTAGVWCPKCAELRPFESRRPMGRGLFMAQDATPATAALRRVRLVAARQASALLRLVKPQSDGKDLTDGPA